MHSRRTTRRRPARHVAFGAIAVIGAAVAVVPTGPTNAELVPCDPIDCPGGPVYAPAQVAIGVHRDLARAQERAEDQAAATCSYDHTFDVVRVQPTLRADGKWEYRLTYRCHSPAYDPWP